MGVVQAALRVSLDGEVDDLAPLDEGLDIGGVGEEFGAAEAGLFEEDGVVTST